jgi:hypothetical protein
MLKNTQKGFVGTLLIIIVAVLAIGGGIYYSDQKETLNIESTEVNEVKDSQTSQKATITLLTPTKNEIIDISAPMKVTWNTSSNFNYPQITITVVTSSNGQAISDYVTVYNTGSAMITVPKNVGVVPYKILIQGAPYYGRGESPFSYSDEIYFTGGIKAQMER